MCLYTQLASIWQGKNHSEFLRQRHSIDRIVVQATGQCTDVLMGVYREVMLPSIHLLTIKETFVCCREGVVVRYRVETLTPIL